MASRTTLREVKWMKEELEPFLPSVTEIDEMDRDKFEMWVTQAKIELIKRANERDPLIALKKRISNILSNNTLSEVQKEVRVMHEIERYERIISQ
jgi:hypothetical protein